MPSENDPRVASNRRRFLQGIGAAGVTGVLAGCADDENGEPQDDDADENGTDGDGTDDEDPDPDPASFGVSELDPADATVTRTDLVDVAAMVENTGEETGTADVRVTVDGDELGSEEVSLDAGDSETVGFELDTTDLVGGEYTHAVETDDDEESGTLTVESLLADPDPLFSFATDPIQVSPGSNTIGGTIDNPYSVAVEDGSVELTVPSGWEVDETDGTDFDELDAGEDMDVEWEITVPDDAEGEEELIADVAYGALDETAETQMTATVESVQPLSAPWGLNNGGDDGGAAGEDGVYGPVEVDGLVFDESIPAAVTTTDEVNAAVRDEQEVAETEYDELYLTEHWGGDLGFDVMLENGEYELILHMAETWLGSDGDSGDGGDGDRVFDISINGELAYEEFDPHAEAGGAYIAVELRDTVEVSDNVLSIETTTYADNTNFKAIEVREAGYER